MEGAANVALFIPIGLLVTQFVSRRRWWLAVATGLTTSVAIEAVQFLLLSERHASLRDVVNNTLGALLGALVALMARPRRRATQGVPGADDHQQIPGGAT